MKKSSVSIVLPNWNGAALLRQNLPTVLVAAPRAEVVVTDDASTDESVKLLRQNFPQVKVVENKVRQGFATNVNRGVAAASGEIVVLLNTDIRPERGFLAPLVSHFSDPAVFAVGCLEESHEKGKIVLRGRGRAKWEKGFFVHWRGEVNKTDTAWVSGGSGAFRRQMWLALGGMDSLYNPFYWEDIDLSYRALKAGYKLIFEPQSRVGHYHEEGKIKKEFSTGFIKRIAYRNQFIFIWKNLSDAGQILLHAFWTPIRLLQALSVGDLALWQGYLWAMMSLPKIIASRRRGARFSRNRDRQVFLPSAL